MKLASLLYCVLLLGSAASAEDLSVSNSAGSQSKLRTLAVALQAKQVVRVEIFQIPPRVLTRTRVTPEMLEHSFHYRVTISDLRGSAYAAELRDAVAATSIVSDSSEAADLRWGIAFFDSADRRLGALYFDGAGKRGAVDSQSAALSASVYKWLASTFGTVLR